MNAILLFPNELSSVRTWGSGTDTCMLPVVDRPILQHVLESIADYGVKNVHALLPSFDGPREKFLGSGSRWGMKVFLWYGDKPTEDMFFGDSFDGDSRVNRYLVGWADCLPQLCELPMDGFSYQISVGQPPSARNWLYLSPSDANKFIQNQPINYEQTLTPTAYLDSSTPARLLESQALVLSKRFPLSHSFAKEIEPGIWIGRNAHVYPSAQLIPPVYVGASACIERDVILGPNAVISRRCVIGKDTVVRDSIVGYHTAVGEHLRLNGNVLLGSVLHCVTNETYVEITDPVIASEI